MRPWRTTIVNLLTKRQKPPAPAIAYDHIPPQLRGQIVLLLRESLPYPHAVFDELDRLVTHEHPVPSFMPAVASRWGSRVVYAYECIAKGDLGECLDAIEIAFKLINRALRGENANYLAACGVRLFPDEAIADLNTRFREHGVGYQFSADQNQLVRVDSMFLHGGVVEPAMMLLDDRAFAGAAQEFAQAHAHHREGRDKEAVAASVKALESVAKSICKLRKWKHSDNATIKPLLDTLFKNGLVPPELDSHFAGLRTALESGLPTIGNRMARHGQGAEVREMPPHIASFALHLCATAIVFLVEAHKAMG